MLWHEDNTSLGTEPGSSMALEQHLKATPAACAKGDQTPGGKDPSHKGSLTSTHPPQEALASVSRICLISCRDKGGVLVAPWSLRLGIARIWLSYKLLLLWDLLEAMGSFKERRKWKKMRRSKIWVFQKKQSLFNHRKTCRRSHQTQGSATTQQFSRELGKAP